MGTNNILRRVSAIALVALLMAITFGLSTTRRPAMASTPPPKVLPTQYAWGDTPTRATATKVPCTVPTLDARLCEFLRLYTTYGRSAAWTYGAEGGFILSDCCVMVMTTSVDVPSADALIQAMKYGSDGHYAYLHSRYEQWVDLWVCPEALAHLAAYAGVTWVEPSQNVQ